MNSIIGKQSAKVVRRFRTFQRAMRNPRNCVLTAWVVATLFAFLITGIRGVPAPSAHDEFSYLLGADTFASGKIANAPHPLWEHFETFHVIQQPSYVSKYPPAQALVLAIGQILGHPIVGACLATGISIAALVWMLIGWLPRRHYWLICLFAALHPGLQFIWGQSYWSGAIALTGSSLLLGALVRLKSTMEIRLSLIAGLGVVLLANSRPFEGAVLTACVGAALLWKYFRTPGWNNARFWKRVVVPGAAVVGVGVLLMLTYNRTTTGHFTKMPYQLHESVYGWTPLFLWKSAGEKPDYRHETIESFYVEDQQETEATFSSLGAIVDNKARVSMVTARFFCSGVGLISLLGLPWLWRKPRYRWATWLLVPVWGAALATPWNWSHYFAPALPLLLVLFFGGLFEVWKRIQSRPTMRMSMQVVGPILVAIWFVSLLTFSIKAAKFGWAKQRVVVQNQLLETEGRDLVLVRYADDHNPRNEWVYNSADIDASDIVWAREMSGSKRNELINYFSDRKIWILDADANPPAIRPFYSVKIRSLQADVHAR